MTSKASIEDRTASDNASNVLQRLLEDDVCSDSSDESISDDCLQGARLLSAIFDDIREVGDQKMKLEKISRQLLELHQKSCDLNKQMSSATKSQKNKILEKMAECARKSAHLKKG